MNQDNHFRKARKASNASIAELQKFNQHLRKSYLHGTANARNQESVPVNADPRVSEYKENFLPWPNQQPAQVENLKSWSPIVVNHDDMNASKWQSEHRNQYGVESEVIDKVPAGVTTHSQGHLPSFFAWDLHHQYAGIDAEDPVGPRGSVQDSSLRERNPDMSEYDRTYQWPPLQERNDAERKAEEIPMGLYPDYMNSSGWRSEHKDRYFVTSWDGKQALPPPPLRHQMTQQQQPLQPNRSAPQPPQPPVSTPKEFIAGLPSAPHGEVPLFFSWGPPLSPDTEPGAGFANPSEAAASPPRMSEHSRYKWPQLQQAQQIARQEDRVPNALFPEYMSERPWSSESRERFFPSAAPSQNRDSGGSDIHQADQPSTVSKQQAESSGAAPSRPEANYAVGADIEAAGRSDVVGGQIDGSAAAATAGVVDWAAARRAAKSPPGKGRGVDAATAVKAWTTAVRKVHEAPVAGVPSLEAGQIPLFYAWEELGLDSGETPAVDLAASSTRAGSGVANTQQQQLQHSSIPTEYTERFKPLRVEEPIVRRSSYRRLSGASAPYGVDTLAEARAAAQAWTTEYDSRFVNLANAPRPSAPVPFDAKGPQEDEAGGGGMSESGFDSAADWAESQKGDDAKRRVPPLRFDNAEASRPPQQQQDDEEEGHSNGYTYNREEQVDYFEPIESERDPFDPPQQQQQQSQEAHWRKDSELRRSDDARAIRSSSTQRLLQPRQDHRWNDQDAGSVASSVPSQRSKKGYLGQTSSFAAKSKKMEALKASEAAEQQQRERQQQQKYRLMKSYTKSADDESLSPDTERGDYNDYDDAPADRFGGSSRNGDGDGAGGGEGGWGTDFADDLEQQQPRRESEDSNTGAVHRYAASAAGETSPQQQQQQQLATNSTHTNSGASNQSQIRGRDTGTLQQEEGRKTSSGKKPLAPHPKYPTESSFNYAWPAGAEKSESCKPKPFFDPILGGPDMGETIQAAAEKLGGRVQPPTTETRRQYGWAESLLIDRPRSAPATAAGSSGRNGCGGDSSRAFGKASARHAPLWVHGSERPKELDANDPHTAAAAAPASSSIFQTSMGKKHHSRSIGVGTEGEEPRGTIMGERAHTTTRKAATAAAATKADRDRDDGDDRFGDTMTMTADSLGTGLGTAAEEAYDHRRATSQLQNATGGKKPQAAGVVVPVGPASTSPLHPAYCSCSSCIPRVPYVHRNVQSLERSESPPPGRLRRPLELQDSAAANRIAGLTGLREGRDVHSIASSMRKHQQQQQQQHGRRPSSAPARRKSYSNAQSYNPVMTYERYPPTSDKQVGRYVSESHSNFTWKKQSVAAGGK